MKEILIIGGGAAGIAAALSAADTGQAHVTILEGLDRVGKKLLATGNGRCNLTNTYVAPEHYRTRRPDRLTMLLRRMTPEVPVDFFRRLGLYCTAGDGGRVYPYCRQASMVVDVLRQALDRSGVTAVCGARVTSLTFEKERFCARTEQGAVYHAAAAVLTAGGKAAPAQGTAGYGYPLAAAFGHKTGKLYPCLVPLRCRSAALRSLKGIRVQCAVRLLEHGAPVAADQGELQLTDYGISGIPAMQLSCCLGVLKQPETAEVSIDFFPGWTVQNLLDLLHRRAAEFPAEPLETAFLGLLHKRIMYALLKDCAIGPLSRPAGSMTKEEQARFAALLKDWRLPVTGTLPWEHAQTTGGGIGLEEIGDDFMSLYRPGLYFAGEILDAAGLCGGYNLHWAWCSGIAAGRAAALGGSPWKGEDLS